MEYYLKKHLICVGFVRVTSEEKKIKQDSVYFLRKENINITIFHFDVKNYLRKDFNLRAT